MTRHRGPLLSRRTFVGVAAAALLVSLLPDFAAAAAAARQDAPQIWFVRHAESDSNLPSNAGSSTVAGGVTPALTRKGIEQAKALAEALGSVPVRAIYASTLVRAVQTADALAFRHTLPVTLAPEAVAIDFGIAPGQDGAAIQSELLRKWVIDKDIEARNGSGESYADVQRRFLPFVRGLMNRHALDSGVIVIVAHGGLLEFMVAELAGNVPADFAQAHRLANTGIIKTELRDSRLYCTEWAGIAMDQATP